MPRKQPLTAAFCRTVKTPGRYGDGGRGGNGLYLRVWKRANGRVGKSWGQRLRIHGRPTNLGLGPYPVVTLAEAREQALENRRAAHRGRDPRGGGIPTFGGAAEKVIALRTKSWKPGSQLPVRWRRSLRRHAYAIWGKRVDRITTADVLGVLTPIWHSKPAAARIAHQRIGAVCKWAIAQAYREDNPAGEAITAALPGGGGHKHHKAVPHAQVSDVIRQVQASCYQPSTRFGIELLALTATRSSEVRCARWPEVDLPAATWTIPGSRMKTGREHRVPLSGRAVEVLRQARERARGELVFPSRRTGHELSPGAFREIMRALKIDGTVHGFRTSFRTWCAETGVDRQLAELALAHTVPGVEGVYQRSDLFEQRRVLMQAWSDYLGR